MEMRQCSLMENGPGLSEKDHLVNGNLIFFLGRDAARNLPKGREMIWIQTEPTPSWFVLYPKKVFVKDNNTHELTPSSHVRNVKTGRFGLSVGFTVSLTSSMG
ncbi:hypothetical protein HPP92_020174 [Vanilla planifolia]|nr:hypothetical protein HPP92_020174 [Vanilla planifolia]